LQRSRPLPLTPNPWGYNWPKIFRPNPQLKPLHDNLAHLYLVLLSTNKARLVGLNPSSTRSRYACPYPFITHWIRLLPYLIEIQPQKIEKQQIKSSKEKKNIPNPLIFKLKFFP